MKRSLLSIAMVVATAPVFAQSISSAAIAALPEPSTISLIAAGFVALALARRKADNTTKP